MSESGLTTRQQLENARARLARARKTSEEQSESLMKTAVSAAVGFGFGKFDLSEKLSVAGFEGEKVLAVGCLAAGMVLSLDRQTENIVDAVGTAATVLTAYKMGSDS
jgi:hypothetical protein